MNDKGIKVQRYKFDEGASHNCFDMILISKEKKLMYKIIIKFRISMLYIDNNILEVPIIKIDVDGIEPNFTGAGVKLKHTNRNKWKF